MQGQVEGEVMKEVILEGIEIAHPAGFMSLIGLLKVLSRSHIDFKISFQGTHSTYFPVLHSEFDKTDLKEFLKNLIYEYRGDNEDYLKPGIFRWPFDVHLTNDKGELFSKDVEWLDELETILSKKIENCDLKKHFQELYDSYCIKLGTERKYTLFRMISGKQQLMDSGVKYFDHLRKAKNLDSMIEDWLFQSWSFDDDESPLGFDEMAARPFAENRGKPDKIKAQSLPRIITWFCLQGITFYPVCYTNGVSVTASKLFGTLGFKKVRSNHYFYWPIWDKPIKLEALQEILYLDLEKLSEDALKTEKLGIVRVYKSERHAYSKYGYAALTAGECIYGS